MPLLQNLITDLAGIRVGHAQDPRVATGVTAIVFDTANVASAVTRGGGPGARDTALLEPEMTVAGIDAVLLSGGSVFGLDAAGGAIALLRQQGRGFSVGSVNVPIAVQATTFDLLNGGDKDWGRMPPYWELGWQADAIRKQRSLRARHGRRRLRRHHRHLQGRRRIGQRGHAVRVRRRCDRRGQRGGLHDSSGRDRISGPAPARSAPSSAAWARRLTCRPRPCACA